jgi:hypothetical protein
MNVPDAPVRLRRRQTANYKMNQNLLHVKPKCCRDTSIEFTIYKYVGVLAENIIYNEIRCLEPLRMYNEFIYCAVRLLLYPSALRVFSDRLFHPESLIIAGPD